MQWEIDALDRMEGTRLSLLNKNDSEPASRPMTPQLFDALFQQ